MRTLSRLLFALLLSASTILATLAQDAHDNSGGPLLDDPPTLQPVFSDDFTTDTRGDYEIEGNVAWEPGKLTLSEGASIAREINGGAWAQVQVTLPEPGAPEHDAAELRVWFLLDGASNCFVRIRQAAEGSGIVSSIAIVDTGEENGRETEQVVRQTDSVLRNPEDLTVEYRLGLCTVMADEAIVLAGYLDNGDAAVAATKLETAAGVGLVRIEAATYRPKTPAIKPEDQQSLAAANAANREMFRLYREGRFAEAAKVYEPAVNTVGDLLGEWDVKYSTGLNNLAQLYDAAGRYEQAEQVFRRAIRIRKTLLGEMHPDYGSSLNNLGTLYYNMKEYARAEPFFQKYHEITQAVLGKQHPEFATSLNNLALVAAETGDLRQAERLYRKALPLLDAAGVAKQRNYAVTLNNLAQVYSRLRDDEQAVDVHRQATDLLRAVLGEQHPDYAASLDQLAVLYVRMGDYDQAEPLFHKGLEIEKRARGEKHPAYATKLNNLAMLYRRVGNDARAEPLLHQACDIRREVLGESNLDYGVSLSNLSSLKYRQGDIEQAETLAAQAVEIVRASLDRSSLVQSERQQKLNQSQERNSLDTQLSIGLHSGASSRNVLESLWQWKGAVTIRQRAYRQVSTTPRLAPVFASLRSVSRQLSRHTRQVPLPPSPTAPREALELFERKKQAWNDEFAVLNRQHEDLQQQIAADSAEFRRLNEALTVALVQRQLPPATALVDFVDYKHALEGPARPGQSNYERRYAAFVVRPDGEPSMVGLGPVSGSVDAIDRMRKTFVPGQGEAALHEEATLAAQELRAQIWHPLEEHLEGIETVIISPDTHLGTLPFAVLPGRQAGSYLIEDYRLASIPFASLIDRAAEEDVPPRNEGDLLVLGNVNYDIAETVPSSGTEPLLLALASEQGRFAATRGGRAEEWESLRGFRDELDTLTSLHRRRFGSGSSIVRLSGTAATEDAFLKEASRFNTLHVITHGFFSDPAAKSIAEAGSRRSEFDSRGKALDVNAWVPGLLSGLVMAGANHPPGDPEDLNDGILRASEIEASSMQDVDLVVLSACETGLGAVAGGEGLTGLQRAFHVAGARSVVASLWKVDDRATQELMRRFYTNLWEHDMSKIDALREAQLWMLRHPKELEAMGVTGAATRGDVRPLKPADTKPRESVSGRSDPFFWAAFQLSGDWR